MCIALTLSNHLFRFKEEKLDEFLHQLTDSSDRRLSPLSAARNEDDTSFNYMLQELAAIMSEADMKAPPTTKPSFTVSKEADRLVWDASSILSDSRPPANFCVYDRAGATTPSQGNEHVPPIFDGSVANATPPPLGGAATGASGGSGTILHLACAMDLPLILAFMFCMGADGRASHTAFRRLVIHEAACNGSIQCLTLLLEMGDKYSKASKIPKNEPAIPFFPHTLEVPHASPLTGRSAQAARVLPPIAMNIRHFRREITAPRAHQGDFLAMLRQFQNLSASVKRGDLTQLQAARSLLEDAVLLDTTRTSLIRSCAFKNDLFVARTFLRPIGCADGHGNTPLHWAAFKNEIVCVSLLLQYDADPNARAHPSGWTPLHDAAYSNSMESIELLVNKGAQVDARANSGATPLCFAAQEDAANAAQLLLVRGADLTARCAGAPQDDGTQQPATPNHPHSRFSGYTPLHYCAHYNAHCAAKVLLHHSSAAKIAMETADLSGRLPIHVAVARGSSDVLKELLHAGARIDVRPGSSPRSIVSPTTAFFYGLPESAAVRRSPSPEVPASPNRNRSRSRSSSTSPVTSPVLRSMIPSQPITSSKPWNCLSQYAIDECKVLISNAEQSWSPDRHLLFTPQDRKAVMELLRVGKRLELQGSGIFTDLWPLVLGFCGRGWFEVENAAKPRAIDFCEVRSIEENDRSDTESDSDEDDNYLALPTLSN
jgi:ankyrin repeat protein